MDNKFVICDKTNNSFKHYISESGENTGDIDSAIKFKSEKEAREYIKENGWGDWAYVKHY